MHPTALAFLSLAAATITMPASAQRLLVAESTNDAIMEFDPMTGALIDAAAIDLATLSGGTAATPIEVIEAANGELWITDQIADGVHRLDALGTTYLGFSSAMLDNVRGGAVIGSNVIVSNAGAGNGAPGDALVEVDGAGMGLGSTPIGNPFDAEPFTFNGVPGYLVSDIDGEDLVFCDGANLANQTIFHDSDGVMGIDFPEQIKVTASGRILAAGFSSPSGIYEYDASGAEIAYIDTVTMFSLGGLRGIHELGNGNLMFTNGGGVHVLDVGAGTVTTVATGVSARFITQTGGVSCICKNYCNSNPNSTGVEGMLTANGSTVVADNDVTLVASDLPTGSFGFFITSQTQGMVPNPAGSEGILCLGGSIGRYVGPGQIQNSGPGGTFSLALDLTQTPQPMGLVSIAAGEAWNFQGWFRDTTAGGMATSNFTNGFEITFQ